MKEPAHVAYDAYRAYLDAQLGPGHTMQWADLSETIRGAWRAAVAAVSP